MVFEFVYGDLSETTIISATCNGVVTIPKQVTAIFSESPESSSFYQCRNTMTHISFQNESSIESIGFYCFSHTSALQIADFSNCMSLSCINNSMFYLSSIIEIILPKNGSIISLLPGCFCGSGIISISIPSTLKTIAGYASPYGGVFTSCTKLKFINIDSESSLMSIGYAIAQSSLVEHIFIPKNVTQISNGAFNTMLHLSSLVVDPSNSKYISIEEIIYSEHLTILHTCACNKQSPISIPNETVYIHSEAFRGCRIQNPFVIPEGVINIYTNTFMQSMFTSITIAYTIQILYHYSFSGSMITSLFIPPSVVLIVNNAFIYSNLQKVVFSPRNQIIEVKNYAFLYSSQLASVVIPVSFISFESNLVFSECPKFKHVYYQLNGYPTNNVVFGSGIRYHALISSEFNNKSNTCGDVEISSSEDECHIIRRYTSDQNFIISSIFHVILIYFFLS